MTGAERWTSSPTRRRARRAGEALACVALVVVLFAMWPQSLGGAVAYIEVSGHSMEPTFHMGDVVVLRSEPGYHRGEVVAFRVPAGEVGAGAEVIHRIVGGDARHGFVTRGDHNDDRDPWRPRPADIVGRKILVVPGVASAFSVLRGPLPLAAFAGLVAVLGAFELQKPRARRRAAPQ
ncbi:MAG TPA: signal peptidase I [Acidimicrobiia bacterium]|jgi:signal peptidase